MALELNQAKQLVICVAAVDRGLRVQIAFDLHSCIPVFRSDSVELVMDLLAYSVPLESRALIVAWYKNLFTKPECCSRLNG